MDAKEDLERLRQALCVNAERHCRLCFEGMGAAVEQCPPNVFRVDPQMPTKRIAFVFDKPNDNRPHRSSPLVPITVYDDRAGSIAALPRAPSHRTLINLCHRLGVIDPSTERLDSSQIHFTNAVKCDVSADTGQSGRIVVSLAQANTCVKTFLVRELDILGTRGIVFFGTNAQSYVLGQTTALWKVCARQINGRDYVVLRVPHTSPTAFNTHGHSGAAYVAPFEELCAAIEREP